MSFPSRAMLATGVALGLAWAASNGQWALGIVFGALAGLALGRVADDLRSR